MRIVIQRVSHASVTIEGNVKSAIKKGYLILLGVCEEDTSEDVEWLVRKVIGLRVFEDENGVMNRSIMDVNGEILVISQFTLFASYPTLQRILLQTERGIRQASWHRRIRCGHESGTAQRRACNYLHGYEE